MVTPYTIRVEDAKLEDLRQKLALTRFPDEIDDAGWSYGAPLSDIKRLVNYWKNGYDWRDAERKLNETMPQFTTPVEVDGFGSLEIHFVHKRSMVETAIPLLFVHGWPGNFLEVERILPILTSTTKGQPSFHVVAPNLPNFGFSEGVSQKGFVPEKYAETVHKLMLALGYNEYVIQGGDWGALISRMVAAKYGPTHCKAWHVNYPVLPHPKFTSSPLRYLQYHYTPPNNADKAGAARVAWFVSGERGYSALQGTKPQTLGYGLADSPALLLAWIYEKLHSWTDSYPWTDDEVLTWVSVYWFSRAGPTASLRIYYENNDAQSIDTNPWFVFKASRTVPLGMSVFPKDLFYIPRSWAASAANLVFHKVHHSGGHFAARERPEAFADDLRKMFGRGGPAFGVVPGCNGYRSKGAARAKL